MKIGVGSAMVGGVGMGIRKMRREYEYNIPHTKKLSNFLKKEKKIVITILGCCSIFTVMKNSSLEDYHKRRNSIKPKSESK